MDLTSAPDTPPAEPVNLLFLHRSIGGHLLAEPGPEEPSGRVHPNGGGLRKALETNNYRVHEATYGSKLGQDTDMFHWLPKFRDHMAEVLRIQHQDQALPAGEVNRVVLFKSCFPNNYFSEGSGPGDPNGPTLTVPNARATLRALLPLFQRQPDTLFVYLTSPPIVGIAEQEPLYKWGLKTLL